MNFLENFHIPRLWVIALLTLAVLAPPATSAAERRGEAKIHVPNRATGLEVEDLTGDLTATDLAQLLAGPGVEISNINYIGGDLAAGTFIGGTGIIGFESGVILSSGQAIDVVGPNTSDNTSTDLGTPGDQDLTDLSGFDTNDATILEFDLVPNASVLFIRYVFASEEYNEFVESSFNDVFAFFVNDKNCALVDEDPVSINTINNGNPFGEGTATNPEAYINNDLNDGGGSIDTEMDGLTVLLTCTAIVNPGVANTLKLAIADASDSILDSAVFLATGGVTTTLGDQIGVVRNSRHWFLDSNDNELWDGCETDSCFTFGSPNDQPVVADWNSDGFSEIGVKRGSQWFLDNNANGAWDGCEVDRCISNWGDPRDLPVGGLWRP
ncbi:MAG: choice-of-anchor L domain-containing protein [Candidatus Competibacteraceae bacterium]|jgi:hypothetical protein|nr:choice-of-anchor L domain-containing protein [Candidatus Competibacteraceae bacterium]